MPNAVPAILFTGVAGIRKRALLRDVAKAMCVGDMHPVGGDDVADAARKYFPPIELCYFAEPDVNAGAEAYRTQALGRLRHSQQVITNAAQQTGVKCLFLHTHATHFIDSQFKSWTSLGGLRDVLGDGVEVNAIVSLVDNSFSILQENRVRGWKLTLPQLVLWRDVEQMASEILARECARMPFDERRDNFFVFSVNHPTQTLTKLVRSLFMPRMPHDNLERLYMSFSIGFIRRQLDRGGDDATQALAILEQNIHFREYFSKHFVSFDPSTIDELPMFHKAMATGAPPLIKVKRSDVRYGGDLWPLCANTLTSLPSDEVEIPTGHIRETLGAFATGAVPTSLIDQYVRSRDFLLVDQSDGIVIFRPTVSGEWSSGTRSEIQRARARRMPIAVIADASDKHAGGAFETGIKDTELYVGDLSDPVVRVQTFDAAAKHLRDGLRQLAQDD